MDKRIIIFIALVFFCGLMISTAGASKFIVTFTDKPHPEIIEPVGHIKYTYQYIPAVAADLPDQAIENLKKNNKIKSIDPDVEVKALGQTTPWGINTIGAITAQQSGDKGAGVNIAIIDTGINYKHLDLNKNYKGGYDFVNNDANPMDDNGHGTHCAGIIASLDNKIGVIGVAPQANLYSLKVLDSTGSGYVSTVIAAIEWAIQNNNDPNKPKIQIISMSLGASSDVPELQSVCDRAYASGILLIAAAGNSGNSGGTGDNVLYPAKYSNSVIAVAATDAMNKRASFSSTGSEVELAAPGVNIYSTYLGNGYTTMSGTSMACPHVTGTAALVMYKNPSLTNTDIRAKLDKTATDLGTSGRDDWYGYGLVNAYDAISA